MPQVTDLKMQIKRPDRVSVYIDDAFVAGLGLWQIGALKLYVGKELSQDDVDSLKQDSDFGKLFDKARNWLALRKRSEWEIRDYLRRKTEDEEMQGLIFAELEKKGFVDEIAFASSWVQNRRATKLVSRRRLEQELRAKRVASDVIQSVLSGDETKDSDILRDLITKKQKQSRYQDSMKLMSYLSRQGFSYQEIKEALDAN